MDLEALIDARAKHRRSFADLVEGLDDRALATPSLCGQWDVRTVAGHLAFAVKPDIAKFAPELLRAAGRFDRANDRAARSMARQPVADLAARIRTHATERSGPPIVGPCAPLADVIVHDGDIRVPLGLAHAADPEAVVASLDFVTSGRAMFFTRKSWLSGLRLVATDVGWSHGEGQQVEGRGVDLLMVACGRRAVLAKLEGPGVDVLSPRLPS